MVGIVDDASRWSISDDLRIRKRVMMPKFYPELVGHRVESP